MRQSGSGILEGHGPGQTDAFFGADINGHTHTTNGRALGDIVDDQDGPQVNGRFVDMNDL